MEWCIYNIEYGEAAMAFLMVIVIYLQVSYNMKTRRNKEFLKLVIWCFVADFLDVLTACTISLADTIPPFLNILLNTGYFLSNAAVCFQFYRYSTMFRNGEKKTPSVNFFFLSLIVLHCVVMMINIVTGVVFTFDDAGNYVHGPIYGFIYVIPYVVYISGVVFMLKNIGKNEWKKRISIIAFAIVGMSGAFVQIFFRPDTLLTMFTISIAIVIVLFSLETPEYETLMRTLDELKIAKEEAEEAKKNAEIANEAKSTFLANMSHEIRTPLTAVLGMNEMILRESTEADIREYAGNVQSAGNGLLTLINDILDISKIESGKMDINPMQYRPYDLLKDCYNMIHTQMQQKGLEFVVENEAQIPAVLYGDELKIKQIAFNLLTNAYKYSNEGTVTLRLKHQAVDANEVALLLSVEDTGIGISEEDQINLFESFERVNLMRNRNVQGTGLGLAITKRFAEAMGGEIGVFSTEGKGSLFYVEIPQKVISFEPMGNFREQYQNSVLEEMNLKNWRAPKARILIVDDVYVNLIVMRNLLKNTEVQIDMAINGKECLEKANKQSYDVILLDHMMPEMDGMDVLRELRKEPCINAQTPIVVVTANAISGVDKEYIRAGFDDYLSKPVSGKSLEEKVLKFLPKELVEGIEE